MIEVDLLTKYYGQSKAVDGLSFTARRGKITGFIGPNGSGKSTTMKMLLGLITPTSGSATINGRLYKNLKAPILEVGALLEPTFLHPGVTIFSHLNTMAIKYRIPTTRVRELLDLVGLSSKRKLRCGQASLGMKQRLGIAQALLGDPGVVVLDEPMNGLDPDGIIWLRTYLSQLAAEGRCIFISSHLMNEMALFIDDVVIITEGKVVANDPLADLIDKYSSSHVEAVTSDNEKLIAALEIAGPYIETEVSNTAGRSSLKISGISAKEIGDLAFRNAIAVYDLHAVGKSLEDIYTALTKSGVGREKVSLNQEENTQSDVD